MFARLARAGRSVFGFAICCPKRAEMSLTDHQPERNNMNKPRFAVLAAMILAAAASRLIPHPPNFTPIAAMALFGGAQFSSKRAAFLVPLAGLFLSDLVFGFYAITPVVYGSFALTVCLGMWVRRRRSVQRIAFATVASAVLFFVLTNFGVWAIDNDCAIADLRGVRDRIGLDLCGEEGEYHTLVTDGPSFTRPVRIRSHSKRTRDLLAYMEIHELELAAP